MLLHLLGTLLPSLLTLYIIHALFITFVPLMGRAGTDNLPDVFIAVLVAFSVILATSYHVSWKVIRIVSLVVDYSYRIHQTKPSTL